MGTEILKSFSVLENELEEAKNSLKGVDENIKRLIGRDPSDLPPRPGQKRLLDDKNPRLGPKVNRRTLENEDNAVKRRNPNSVFHRLSEKVYEDPIKNQSKGLISKVIPAQKEIPSRQDALAKQNKDEKFKARNRRMFGALLGTLQKFQQEESKMKKKDEKRIQIEKKIEEHELQEKEEIKKERQELFLNRRKKQQEIKMIELKMLRMKEYGAWEETQKPRKNFIITKAKPHIHYLPRKMDDKSKELLEKSKKDIEEQIEKRRKSVVEELNHIEDRMRRNFEPTKQDTKEQASSDKHDRHRSDDEYDEDGDTHMKSTEHEDEKKQENTVENTQSEELKNGNVEKETNDSEELVPEEPNAPNTDLQAVAPEGSTQIIEENHQNLSSTADNVLETEQNYIVNNDTDVNNYFESNPNVQTENFSSFMDVSSVDQGICTTYIEQTDVQQQFEQVDVQQTAEGLDVQQNLGTEEQNKNI